MRIGIVGDTHGDMSAIREVVKRAGLVDLWLHTGDHAKDAKYLEHLVQVPVHAVTGNCDVQYSGVPDLFLTLEGHYIMLTHGHRYHVKQGLRELSWWGRKYEADIVIFGHTHSAVIEQEVGLLLFNPGSPTCPRADMGATFGIIELSEEGVYPSIITLDKQYSVSDGVKTLFEP